MGASADVVNSYLDAFTSGNIGRARELVDDGFQFHGPMMHSDGAAVFFEGTQPLVPMIAGYKMLHQWEDGGDVCSVYEFQLKTPSGPKGVLMSEWNQVHDGKLTSARLVFDTVAFNAAMGA